MKPLTVIDPGQLTDYQLVWLFEDGFDVCGEMARRGLVRRWVTA